MTAQIVETNSTPFKTVDVDTVTVDIIENALKNDGRRPVWLIHWRFHGCLRR